jgi:hypothetical protein
VKSRTRVLALLLAPLLLRVAPSRAQERTEIYDVVRGNWTITSKNIENDEWVTKTVEIYQNGTQLSGRFQGPNQDGGIEGFVNGHHIEFSTKTKNVLTFRGEVDGNTMSGNYGLHGRHAPFKAVRTNPNPTH